jgi:small redox-active disulfide protein 2
LFRRALADFLCALCGLCGKYVLRLKVLTLRFLMGFNRKSRIQNLKLAGGLEMKIQILGTGCAKCKKMTEVAEKAATDLGIDYEIEKVTEIVDIMQFGVMSTPGLVVDGKVVVAGKVPTEEKMKELLSK